MAESDLVLRCQNSFDNFLWTLGRDAAGWEQRYARGRSLSEFASLVGAGVSQVMDAVAVWKRFWAVAGSLSELRWAHFRAALDWPESEANECLQWAREMCATTAEMRAWRRAKRGEDLTLDE